MATPQPKTVIDNSIEEVSDSLRDLSDKIWANPELAYQEKFAHDTLTEYLEKRGFCVNRKYVVDTAFRAVYKQGDGGPNIGLICEYDALPEIGHACGHNLIAEAGVASAIGLRAAMEANPTVPGTLTVLGTPAEEVAGGKIKLIEADAFRELDVCMMVHPGLDNMMAPVVLALNYATVTFTGKASHAAAAPWDGLNALDAAVSAYASLSMLRQQLKPNCRIHAIISDGGRKPNIIPERAVLEFFIRATTDKELGGIKEKMTAIMTSAAMATGCDVSVKYRCEDKPAVVSNVVTNGRLVESYAKHWQSFKPAHPSVVRDDVWASTDMGNVSYVLPSIHPVFTIGCSANIHTKEFANYAMAPEAHAATRCVAKAMSAVGWDVLTDSSFLEAVKQGFRQQMSSLA